MDGYGGDKGVGLDPIEERGWGWVKGVVQEEGGAAYHMTSLFRCG